MSDIPTVSMEFDLDDCLRIEEALADARQTTTPLYYRVQRCRRSLVEQTTAMKAAPSGRGGIDD